jgi:CRISPR-associated protein Cas1
MVGRVVDISTDGLHLSVFRGFMTVSKDHAEVGRVPLDDIAAVVGNAHGLSQPINFFCLIDNTKSFTKLVLNVR